MKKTIGTLMCTMVMVMATILPLQALAVQSQVYYLPSDVFNTYNTGLDNGFSGKKTIGKDDPHFGWSLGEFTISDFTDIVYEDSIPVFLVTAGDNITLKYNLYQNLDKLDSDEKKTICEDTNGYDLYFQTVESNTGRGILYVGKIDYKNKFTRDIQRRDFLRQVSYANNRYSTVSPLEEGDYEVALDYEIKSSGSIHNYRTTVKFKVRNGNSMVFLMDKSSKTELGNYSVAETGFYLDKAASKYLKVIVTREIIMSNGSNLSLITRECKPGADGNTYTEAGIYTVNVTNQYTHESVEFKVSVGDDPLINAYVKSGCVYTPQEIDNMISSGNATIDSRWNVVMKNAKEKQYQAD